MMPLVFLDKTLGNEGLCFHSKGKYSKQTLRDVGTFFRYLETPNNVKVSSSMDVSLVLVHKTNWS